MARGFGVIGLVAALAVLAIVAGASFFVTTREATAPSNLMLETATTTEEKQYSAPVGEPLAPLPPPVSKPAPTKLPPSTSDAGTTTGGETPETAPASTTTEEPPEPPVEEFLIEADDRGFYISDEDIETISVAKDNTIHITFLVRETRVYYGGLDFLGCGEKTGTGFPGESVSMEFLAEKNCTIVSYWPRTSATKDRLKIEVVPQ